MDSMRGFFSLAYAGKAWVAAFTAVVTQIVAAVQLAAADQAISLTEAKGVWLLVTEAAGMVAGMVAVFRRRNGPGPA